MENAERKSPGGTSWLARATRWALGVCLLLVGSGMIAVGCDAKTEYRVLSFFLDGVPPPPGVKPPKRKPKPDPWGERAERARAASRPSATRPALAKVEFYHAPYRQRQCMECHSRDISFTVPVDTTTVCRKCHQQHYLREADDWVHGPVAMGKCSMCHVSHKSEHRGLLTKASPDLCFQCHHASRTLAAPYHAQAEQEGCASCHDPHSTGNRLLLVDARSYRRRKSRMTLVGSAHSRWTRKDCATCHLLEKSNAPIKDVNQRCLNCHKKVHASATGGGYLHDPVRKGQCTACHVAHKSTLPKLIKPDAEANCTPCHSMEEVLKKNPAHPSTRRVECLLCHRGHTARGKHLLNDLGRAVQAAGEAPGPRPARWDARPAVLRPRQPTTQPASEPTTRPATRKAGVRP